MHRRLYRHFAALSALPLLAGGCTQMTRHSNMVVFGTNTVVGLRVGTNATQVPSIDLGYTRQEAVLMPVVANTSVTRTTSTTSDGKQTTSMEATKLAPCDLNTPIKVEVTAPAGTTPPAIKTLVHPCLLVASNEKEGAKDSYSVLASFGANFGAGSEPTNATARGGLAQYFATGMAAQLLALNGGAAVVAAGPAAQKAAEGPKMTLSGEAVAITPTAETYLSAGTTTKSYGTQLSALTAKIRATQQSDLASRFTAFQGAIGGLSSDIMSSGCATPDKCAEAVEGGYYYSNYKSDPAKFQAAVTAWQ